MNDKHEKEVKERFAAYLSKHKKLCEVKVEYPDVEETKPNLVDIRLRHRNGVLVIEHTRVESYTDQIRESIIKERIFRPILDNLTGKLLIPLPGHYIISVDSNKLPLDEIKKKDEDVIRAAIEEWVRETAPQLEIGSPKTAPNHMRQQRIIGVPFDVYLSRWPRFDGNIYFSGFSPDDLEVKRMKRVETAIHKKCGKLLRTAKSENAVSVLLLENHDWSLGDDEGIAKAAFQIFDEKPDLEPDEFYVINSSLDTWHVCLFRVNKQNSWPEESGVL